MAKLTTVAQPPMPVIPPPPTTNVIDGTGKTIGALPISDHDKVRLAATGTIIMSFHTPRMFRETMAVRNFTVTLTQDTLGNVVGDPGQIAQATTHLAEVASAQALGVIIKPGSVLTG